MINSKHKKLDVWNLGVQLTTETYAITNDFPDHELYGLTSQLRRTAISVPSNITEGSSRKSPKERSRFFKIARSFLVEVDTQLEIARKLNYISKEQIDGIEDKLEHSFAMLCNLIKKT